MLYEVITILGDLWFTGAGDKVQTPAWHKLLAQPEARLHLYGKELTRRGRKMGHVTLLGADAEAATRAAIVARTAIGMAPAEAG